MATRVPLLRARQTVETARAAPRRDGSAAAQRAQTCHARVLSCRANTQLQTEKAMSMKTLPTITLAAMTIALTLTLAPPTHASPALTNPTLATATAPATFKVKVTT